MGTKQRITMVLILFISILLAGCIPTVSSADLYHSDALDPDLGGAKNITVEQTSEGMKITGDELSVLLIITPYNLQIITDPKGTNPKINLISMNIDDNGNLAGNVNISLGKNSNVPAILPMTLFGMTGSIGGSISTTSYKFIPGASNSQNISVKIDQSVGHTDVAGLQFTNEVIINVWEDGKVEVNKKGIVALDSAGKKWVSKEVKFGSKTAILMIKDK